MYAVRDATSYSTEFSRSKAQSDHYRCTGDTAVSLMRIYMYDTPPTQTRNDARRHTGKGKGKGKRAVSRILGCQR